MVILNFKFSFKDFFLMQNIYILPNNNNNMINSIYNSIDVGNLTLIRHIDEQAVIFLSALTLELRGFATALAYFV